jgi:hypothetical protein
MEEAPMKKTLVGTENGSIVMLDTIEHQGGLWLVTEWLEHLGQGARSPRRIIRLDVLPYKAASFGGSDYILSSGHIPKDVLECKIPQEQVADFVVIDLPEIFLKLPDRTKN